MKVWKPSSDPTTDDSHGAAQTAEEAQLDAEIEAELGRGMFPQLHMGPDGHGALPVRRLLWPDETRAMQRQEEEAITDHEEESYHKTAASKSFKDPAASKIPVPSNVGTDNSKSSMPSNRRVTRAQQQSTDADDVFGSSAQGRGRARSRSAAPNPFETWTRTKSPLTGPTELGSPTRKPRRAGMATRSSARTRRCL